MPVAPSECLSAIPVMGSQESKYFRGKFYKNRCKGFISINIGKGNNWLNCNITIILYECKLSWTKKISRSKLRSCHETRDLNTTDAWLIGLHYVGKSQEIIISTYVIRSLHLHKSAPNILRNFYYVPSLHTTLLLRGIY